AFCSEASTGAAGGIRLCPRHQALAADIARDAGVGDIGFDRSPPRVGRPPKKQLRLAVVPDEPDDDDPPDLEIEAIEIDAAEIELDPIDDDDTIDPPDPLPPPPDIPVAKTFEKK